MRYILLALLLVGCGYSLVSDKDYGAEMRDDPKSFFNYDDHNQILRVNLLNCLATKSNDHIAALVCADNRPVAVAEEEPPHPDHAE